MVGGERSLLGQFPTSTKIINSEDWLTPPFTLYTIKRHTYFGIIKILGVGLQIPQKHSY